MRMLEVQDLHSQVIEVHIDLIIANKQKLFPFPKIPKIRPSVIASMQRCNQVLMHV